MRLALTLPLLAALTLSACTGGVAVKDRDNDLAPTCAEQSEWASQGRTDGGTISITCP